MGYTPLIIKPPLPPLRPPVAPPYRPPGTNPLPPTLPFPIYQPPDLLPPTGLDLKGIVCIYSNASIWELKKIRYRYPGESWQEIAGDRYTTMIESGWNPLPLVRYNIQFEGIDFSNQVVKGGYSVQGGFTLTRIKDAWGAGAPGGGIVRGDSFELRDMNGTRNLGYISSGTWIVKEFPITPTNLAYFMIKMGSFKITAVIRSSDNQNIPLNNKCTFKVFNIFNQEILSITRDVCPEAIVVPERCYFKPENERLVKKINLSPNMSLRTEYNGNCATVWMDLWPLNYFPPQIYKECSDNPNCPPPRIRFDKKCEETCKQCPSGTAIKVLLGNRIACVDAFGCIKKMIQFKPGCNTYDCICN